MKFLCCFLIVAVGGGSLTVAHAQSTTSTELTNSPPQKPVTYASKLVQISYNPSILPVNAELVTTLLTSTSVGGAAVQEFLGAAYPDARQVLQYTTAATTIYPAPPYEQQTRGGILYGRIQAQSFESREKTDALLAKATGLLQKSLQVVGQQALAKHQQLAARIKAKADQANQDAAAAQAEYDKLLASTGGVSAYELRNELTSLKRQVSPTSEYFSSTDLGYARRRMESAEAELEGFKQRAKAAPQQADTDLAAWEAELAQANKTLESLTTGVPAEKRNTTEITSMQRRVTLLQDRILNRRQLQTNREREAAESLTRLERTLREATAEFKDKETRLKNAKERINQIEKDQLVEKAQQAEKLKQSVDQLKATAQRAQAELNSLQSTAEFHPLPELLEVGVTPSK